MPPTGSMPCGRCRQDLPDVLITDVEMPGMDGFELTRHIRADPQSAQLPVIMITAADDRHREQADAAGVSVLLGKPYPEDALIAHIRLAMGQDGPAPPAAGRARTARSTHWPDRPVTRRRPGGPCAMVWGCGRRARRPDHPSRRPPCPTVPHAVRS